MIERIVVEYLANAVWQIPLLAGGAWLLLRVAKAGLNTQYTVWLAVLILAIALPLHGMARGGTVEMRTNSVAATPREQNLEATNDSGIAVESSAHAGETGWFEAAARPRRLVVPRTAARWIVRLYASVMIFGLCRVLRAWRVARRLVEESREISLAGEHTVVLEDYGRRLRIRLPEMRESVEISSPLIVGIGGIAAPVLLLPERFAEHGSDEMKAALLHELAHVKRRDYLVNALCQIAALPVIWHPATHWVHARVRRTREMICDRMAAEEMRSEIGYARCLLHLAEAMLDGREFAGHTAGIGLFSNNVLEERVMRLTETKTTMRLRTRLVRAASGTAAIAATMAITVMFHLTPALAAQNPLTPEQDAQAATAASSSSTPANSPKTVTKPDSQTKPASPSVADSTTATARETASAKKREHVERSKNIYGSGDIDSDPQSYAIVDGVRRPLTPEEKAKLHDDLARAQKEIAQAQAKIQSPEFRKQIEDAVQQAAKAKAFTNSPEFRKQIEDARNQAAKARDFLNSPEFKQQIEQMRETNESTLNLDMAKMQDEIHKATAQLDSPEFRKQMEAMQKIDMAPMQRQLDDAMKKLNHSLNEDLNADRKIH